MCFLGCPLWFWVDSSFIIMRFNTSNNVICNLYIRYTKDSILLFILKTPFRIRKDKVFFISYYFFITKYFYFTQKEGRSSLFFAFYVHIYK